MSAFRVLAVVALAMFAYVSRIAASEPGDQLSSPDLTVLLAANALCKPFVVEPQIIDAAVQRIDNATPFDVRAFLIGQRRMMVEASKGQPPMYVDNICGAARFIASEHNILAGEG